MKTAMRTSGRYGKKRVITTISLNPDDRDRLEAAGFTVQELINLAFDFFEATGHKKAFKLMKDRIVLAKFKKLSEEDRNAANDF